MKNILLVCFSFFMLAACKKSNSAASDYYRMTINGENVACNSGIRANKTTAQNNLLDIFGQWTGGSLEIQVFSFNNKPGTWPVNAVLGSSSRFTLSVGQNQYFAGDGGIVGPQLGGGKVIISEVGDDFVKGSFDFVTAPDLFTNLSKTVTAGEFNIKRNY